MLGNLVELALRQRLLVIVASLALAFWGFQSYRALPIDAFPDVSPTQVLVIDGAPKTMGDAADERLRRENE